MIYKNDSLHGMRKAGWKQDPVPAANGTPVYALAGIRDFCAERQDAVNFLGGFEGYDEDGDYKAAKLDGLYVDERGYGWAAGPDGAIRPEAVMRDGKAYQVVRSPSTLMNAMSGQPSGYMDVRDISDPGKRGEAVRALEDSAFLQSTKRGRTKTAEFSLVGKGDYAVLGYGGDRHGELVRTVEPAADAWKDGRSGASPVSGYGITKDHSCDELARRAAGLENGNIAYLNFRKGDPTSCPASGGPVQEISDGALRSGCCFADDAMPGTVMDDVSVPCLMPFGDDADQSARTLALAMARMQSTSGKETVLLVGAGKRALLRDSAVDYGATSGVPEAAPVHLDPENALSPDMDLERVGEAIRSWGAEADAGACVQELSRVHAESAGINPSFYGKAFVGDGPTRDAADYTAIDSGLAAYAPGDLPAPRISWAETPSVAPEQSAAPEQAAESAGPAAEQESAAPASGFGRLLGILKREDAYREETGQEAERDAETKGGQLSVEDIV